MARYWLIVAVVLAAANMLLQIYRPEEAHVREWLAATSGWAAVFAAIPTLFYLSKQVRDADHHQRINVAIQLRRHRILATRAGHIAFAALEMIKMHEDQAPEGSKAGVWSWDRETVDAILHHLRDGTILSFESEIAYPAGCTAWSTALAVEQEYQGHKPAVYSASAVAKDFFAHLGKQAEAYLEEIEALTGRAYFMRRHD